MGFFTDPYDLFTIDVVMALLKPMWQVGKVKEGLVESAALLAAAFDALPFGRIADGRPKTHLRCRSSRPRRLSKKLPGLVARRMAECKLFTGG